ncbi:MAG: hypothetical protein QNI86_11080 [Halieaceae bacterium]|nr:hypothetical protein [Halieaceae bacterium]
MDDRASESKSAVIPSEMEIVDCFTRLIFGDNDALSEGDRTIVETLSLVDCNLAHCSDAAEVGAYLRELGVREMIRLVRQVQDHYPSPAQTGSPSWSNQPARA